MTYQPEKQKNTVLVDVATKTSAAPVGSFALDKITENFVQIEATKFFARVASENRLAETKAALAVKTSGRTIAPSSITSPQLLTAFCTFTNELTSIWRADGSVTMGMSHGNRTT